MARPARGERLPGRLPDCGGGRRDQRRRTPAHPLGSRWLRRRQEALATLFVRHGLAEERSRRLGAFVIAAVEGVVIRFRAEQNTTPIEAAATEIHDLLLHTLRDRPRAAESGPRP
ncbi:hypothetical protein PV331_28860 [Streptomyces sp. WI04-05B]|nr:MULTISPECIES: hypothetical protein [unclassified Streptomyces]MDX2545836.1 hypothetical protein [Streptomyces sp. WI04-05B]MDX2586395.1 hypothetical protein [Streptomyces sp. WI04-05A]